MTLQRIGILGGTFDPIHNGHLQLARAALAGLQLSKVIFIPAAQPPHKGRPDLLSFEQRQAMVELALAAEPRFELSCLEAQRQGPSYSVDTLRALRQRLGAPVQLFFLLGLDAFAELASWKEYERLPQLANLVVVHRFGSARAVAETVLQIFPQAHCEGGGWQLAEGTLSELAMPPCPVSSTEIRKRLAQGDDVAALLPGPVLAYIREKGLYS